MSINYNDYSRRGLVAMNKMFDADNDQMLSGYVSESKKQMLKSLNRFALLRR